jgi:acetyl-CoA carboxylase biotin carboxyl carrier protein
MAKKPRVETKAGTEVRGVDLAEVERLLAFMQKHGLEEFEYERGGVHMRLKKSSMHPAGAFRPLAAGEAILGPPQAVHGAVPAAPAAGGRELVAAEAAGRAEDLHVIKSPIVGTFYTAPKPSAQPFVAVGDRVESGHVLCIIEAMKLMNEIESDVAGEIARIFVENGQPVEYGEPLFGIRPHGKK